MCYVTWTRYIVKINMDDGIWIQTSRVVKNRMKISKTQTLKSSKETYTKIWRFVFNEYLLKIELLKLCKTINAAENFSRFSLTKKLRSTEFSIVNLMCEILHELLHFAYINFLLSKLRSSKPAGTTSLSGFPYVHVDMVISVNAPVFPG